MDAFIEIIEKLIEAIPPRLWTELSYFPFKFLKEPKGRLYDTCIFEITAHNVYGFLWVEYEDHHDLYIMPFCLARYKEDGDLISLPPWSLRNASSDSYFYETWRKAHKQRNPIITAKKGCFFHKKYPGDASFVAVAIWNDARNSCVRVDFQIAYKIFRIAEKNYPQSLEVEMLSYLASQSIFTNFAPMISVFEYTGPSIQKSHVAIGLRYIQNNGQLFNHFISLLRTARFPKILNEKKSKVAWQNSLKTCEDLGRMLANFHSAMAHAPRNSNLAPEQTHGELREKWFNIINKIITERLETVLKLQPCFPIFAGVFHLLPNFSKRILERIKQASEIAIRIQCHGYVHLGQILVGNQSLILLDYESDPQDNPEYKYVKHSFYEDVTSLACSLRFAWYFIEKKYYTSLLDEKDESSFEIENNKFNKSQIISPKNYHPSIEEIESTFNKFYFRTLNENINSSYLQPKSHETQKDLYNLYMLLRILKEIIREFHDGNPRSRIWLHILQDFMIGDSN